MPSVRKVELCTSHDIMKMLIFFEGSIIKLQHLHIVIGILYLKGNEAGKNSESFNLQLFSHDVRGQINHFWRSTGFCPPKPHNDSVSFFLGPDMQQNLAYIGALPHQAIKQVRVHWLLDLVFADSIANSSPKYNFTLLDEFVALVHQNGLTLGFELMGNPSGIFNDMDNKTQVFWWRDLVHDTAQRYIELYGIDYVRQWNFETWNEPDCHDFDENKMSVQGFLNYYDACSEGLAGVNKFLIFGGPGDGCGRYLMLKRSSKYSNALFNHVIYGTNFFTGKQGIRIDFISLHEKGDSKAINILKKEFAFAKVLKMHFPKLGEKPFYNDEADPLVGWSKPKEWRADCIYSGLVTKVIAQHQNVIKASSNPTIANYTLLSNDNGFLSYHPNQFTQRTLLARFQMNNTRPSHVTFVRKPIYLVTALLSLLGEQQVHVDVSDMTGHIVGNLSDFGVLVTVHKSSSNNTSDNWQMTVLVYKATDPINLHNHPNIKRNNESTTRVNLKWNISLPRGTTSLRLLKVTCNNNLTNPYAVWVNQFNRTDFPKQDQLLEIRKQEFPHSELIEVPVERGEMMTLSPVISMIDPQVTVLHLCARPSTPPEMVTGVRFLNITAGQVMVIWSDQNIQTKCILTYDVEYSATHPDGPYIKLNYRNSSVTVFLLETDSEHKVRGFYRLRAVDYWYRAGDYTSAFLYS